MYHHGVVVLGVEVADRGYMLMVVVVLASSSAAAEWRETRPAGCAREGKGRPQANHGLDEALATEACNK